MHNVKVVWHDEEEKFEKEYNEALKTIGSAGKVDNITFQTTGTDRGPIFTAYIQYTPKDPNMKMKWVNLSDF